MERVWKRFKSTYNIPREVNEIQQPEEELDNSTALGILIAVVIFIIVLSYTDQFIAVLISTAYPLYGSITALDCEVTDQIRWLKYWVVYGLFSFVEPFLNFFIGNFSQYWFFKCVFFIWLMFPFNYGGSDIIYRDLVLPLYTKIDNILQRDEKERL